MSSVSDTMFGVLIVKFILNLRDRGLRIGDRGLRSALWCIEMDLLGENIAWGGVVVVMTTSVSDEANKLKSPPVKSKSRIEPKARSAVWGQKINT